MIDWKLDDRSSDASPTDVVLSRWNLRDVLASIRVRLEVDVVTVLQLDPASRHLVTVWTESEPRVPPMHHRVPVGRGLAGRVAERGEAILLDDVTDDDLVNPALLAMGVRSVMAVPVRHAGRLIGVLKVGTRAARHFGSEQLTLLMSLAPEVDAALQNFFLADERAAAAALQRSLVPSRLPSLEGLELAGRYVPGQGGVSGDWYDVFSLPSGRIGLVMGDVAGHGLPASVVMGRLRSALRAYSLEYDDPADVLRHLDAKIVHFEPGAMATAVYAVTQPPFDVIRISSAGHMLPIMLDGSGSAHDVDVPVSLPLGVDAAAERTSADVRLGSGSTLVLYTDGLIERRSRSSARSSAVFDSIASASEELRRNLTPGPAEEIASRILDSMLTIEPPIDDVAILVVRRVGS